MVAGEGNLCIADSWPGQMRTVYGNHQRFIDTYFTQYPGRYFTGDGARRDEDGDYWITGRVDDVINVSGHRMGTAEVESALVAHPQVAEAAVVGFPHEIKGQGIYAYVTLMAGQDPDEELRGTLGAWVREQIGPIARPDLIQWAPGLPKTRSGKIMRRILRKIAGRRLCGIGRHLDAGRPCGGRRPDREPNESGLLMKPALAAIALALILPASAALAEDQKGPPAALVVVDHAVKQFVSPTALYSATVISRDDAKLAGEIAGRLTWVAEVGDRFLKGETVAKLDDTFFRQQVIEEQSIIQREQAKFDFHTRQVERLEKLLKENNIARSQVDQERMDRSVAHNNILSAQARLSQAKERLKRTSILAPFDGVVSERWLQAGEWADNGDAIVRLVSADNLEVETHIPASSLKLATVGTPLTYTDGKTSGTGTVRTIVPIGGDVSRLYELRLSVTDPSLSAGNLLRVAVPTALPREAVLVPRDALVLRREGIYVYRVNQESIAERVAVQTGIATPDRIEVVGGIREHDRVVIRGGENLRPGMPVQVKPL